MFVVQLSRTILIYYLYIYYAFTFFIEVGSSLIVGAQIKNL